jgi:hypothetical protein
MQLLQQTAGWPPVAQAVQCLMDYHLYHHKQNTIYKLWPKENFKSYSMNLYNIYNILALRGPCIVIYSYNESQQDALFLKFI